MKLKPIEKISGISPQEFQETYLNSKTPVVLTDLASDWPATEKWTWDFLKSDYGHLEVPLFGKDYNKAVKTYLKPTTHMKLGDYLDLIRNEPTDLRMFLYNIFEHAPDLADDFTMPTIMNGFMEKYQYMFFGGCLLYTSDAADDLLCVDLG